MTKHTDTGTLLDHSAGVTYTIFTSSNEFFKCDTETEILTDSWSWIENQIPKNSGWGFLPTLMWRPYVTFRRGNHLIKCKATLQRAIEKTDFFQKIPRLFCSLKKSRLGWRPFKLTKMFPGCYFWNDHLPLSKQGFRWSVSRAQVLTHRIELA